MAVQSATIGSIPNTPVRRETNLWLDALSRLVQNRAAVAGVIVIVGLLLMAIFAPYVAPKGYADGDSNLHDQIPGWFGSIFPNMVKYAKVNNAFPLGADYLGRDLLSRIVYGARVSLSVAFVGPFISLLVGVLFGSIAGYLGGRVDNLMMRFVDVMYAFPQLLFVILLMAYFRSTTEAAQAGTLRGFFTSIDTATGGMFFIFVGLGATAWMNMARLTRGQILAIKEQQFVEAARTVGATTPQIMFRHILPNILGPIVVAETLAIPTYISTEAFLSFIGLGVNPPTPSWGSMIAGGAQVLRTYPNQAIFPALALAITMFAFNFLGDGLRDAFDPRMRGTQ